MLHRSPLRLHISRSWQRASSSVSFLQTQSQHTHHSPELRATPSLTHCSASATSTSQALVVTLCKPPSTSTSTLGEEIPAELRKLIEECVEDGSFSAQAKEKYVLRLPPTHSHTHSHTHSSSSVSDKTSTSYRHLVLLGLGSSPSSNDYKEVGKQIASLAKDIKAPNVDIHLDSDTHTETNANISSILRGLSNSSYNDKRYKGTGSANDTIDTLKSVTFTGVPDGRVSAVTEMLDLHMLTMRGVTVAKDLVGAPPNSKTPLAIGDFARDIAATCENMECKVLELEECTEAKMGGFLAVQQGSKFPPQFIHMTYKNKNTTVAKKRIAIVGKGLTFDSGGYNLKVGPGSMIEMMKFDMGGMGAVLGAATAVGALDSSLGNHSSLLDGIEVHFISAVCENMISRDAMRPGDIVTASNGKTIEILNTDAEGRLTLADALVYADTVVKADVIVDMATLTGASMIALGENVGSLFSSSDRLQQDLLNAAKRSGDQLWPMPLHEEYEQNIKSKIADIKNIGDGKAGSITAALFLKEFVAKGKEWAHIDMAGPVWDNTSHKPTGYGVALLVDFLLQQARSASQHQQDSQ